MTNISNELFLREHVGFINGRSCVNNLTLKIIIEKVREFGTQKHVVFVDYEKAFDQVNKHELWEHKHDIHNT
jgi:hypothetical protein